MSKIISGVLSIAFLIFANNALAASLFNSLQQAKNNAPLGSITISGTSEQSPEGIPSVHPEQAMVFVGSDSQCNDLRLVDSSSNVWLPVGSVPLTSHMLTARSKELGMSQIGCMKFDFIKGGQTYTTHNISFIWNKERKEYDQMIPQNVTVVFP